MCLPRPRFTVRTLMIAVAIVAVAAAIAVGLRRRSQRFMRLAYDHEDMSYTRPGDPVASYHDRLSWKYQQAARYPWLSVPPDPPEPE
jgi:hypothetical protein